MASEFIHQTLALTPTPDSSTNDEPNTTISTSSSTRKPRGRPPGSKNKPKPPVIITKESESAMHPMFLEVASNSDILDATFSFSRLRHLGISVISASGAVSSFSLRHPTLHSSTLALTGRFEILSLSGTFFPDSGSARAASFTISVAGAQGQVIGGTVVGGLVAAGTVVVTAAGFLVPEFHRLPVVVEGDHHGGVNQETAEDEMEHHHDAKDADLVGPSTGQQQHVQEMVLWGAPTAAPVMRAVPPHSHRAPQQPQPPNRYRMNE